MVTSGGLEAYGWFCGAYYRPSITNTIHFYLDIKAVRANSKQVENNFEWEETVNPLGADAALTGTASTRACASFASPRSQKHAQQGTETLVDNSSLRAQNEAYASRSFS